MITLLVITTMSIDASAPPQLTASIGERSHTVYPANRMPVPTHEEPERSGASLTPTVTVRNGTTAQRERLAVAIARFTDAGLALPDLEIRFEETEVPCSGSYGVYQDTFTPVRITFCSTLDAVYEHELAHAWEDAMVTDAQRSAFMESLGYAVWQDNTVPWVEQGIEGMAIAIQQGLAGLPLPPVPSDRLQRQVDAFETLTGFPDTRVAARNS